MGIIGVAVYLIGVPIAVAIGLWIEYLVIKAAGRNGINESRLAAGPEQAFVRVQGTDASTNRS